MGNLRQRSKHQWYSMTNCFYVKKCSAEQIWLPSSMHVCEYWLHVFSHGSQRPISPGSLSRKMWAMLAFSTGCHWLEMWILHSSCQFLRWPQTTVSLTHCCQTVPPHSQECRTWIKHFWLLCDGCVCEQFTVLHFSPCLFSTWKGDCIDLNL